MACFSNNLVVERKRIFPNGAYDIREKCCSRVVVDGTGKLIVDQVTQDLTKPSKNRSFPICTRKKKRETCIGKLAEIL